MAVKRIYHHTGNFKISIVIRLFTVIMLLISIWKNDWIWFIASLLIISVSFVPAVLQKNYKITLPWQLELLMMSTIILHFGGGAIDAYDNIHNYDTLTHFVSSVFIAFFAFAIVFILDEYGDTLRMNTFSMAFLVIIFTMSMGVLWELLEWSVDYFLQTNLQAGLDDTMKDLFVDTIAGFIMAVIGVHLVKKGRFREITRVMGEDINRNINNRNKIDLEE